MNFFDESYSTGDKQALVEQLNDIITENFKLHKNNQINIAGIMVKLIIARTVNLNLIAAYLSQISKVKQKIPQCISKCYPYFSIINKQFTI